MMTFKKDNKVTDANILTIKNEFIKYYKTGERQYKPKLVTFLNWLERNYGVEQLDHISQVDEYNKLIEFIIRKPRQPLQRRTALYYETLKKKTTPKNYLITKN